MVQTAGNVRWELTLTLGVLGATLLAKLIGILLLAARKRVLSSAVAAIRDMVIAVRSWRRAADDEVAVEAKKRIRKLKVEHMRYVCQTVAVMTLPLNVNTFLLLARGEALLITPVQDGLWSLFHVVTTVPLICPYAVSWRIIDALYIVLASIVVLAAAPLPVNAVAPTAFSLILMVENIFVAAASFARRDFYVVAPMNVCFAISASAGMWSYRYLLQLERVTPVVIQWLVTLLVLGVTRMLEANWWMLTVQGLAVRAAKQLLSAATALLRSYCDTVVEVDEEGVILVPARDLGSFLLRGPDYSLRGYRLADLMAEEEDRRAFAARLGAPREGGMDNAESLPVHMRDGNGSVLKLHLIFFAFTHVDDSVRYMVGIRGDFPALGERGQQPEQQPEAPWAGVNLEMAGASVAAPSPRAGLLPPDPHERPCAGGATPPAPRSLGSGESSAALQAEDTVSEPSDAMQPILVLDAEGRDYPVLECSPGFRARVGRLPPNSSLGDIVRDTGAAMAWMRRTMTCIVYHRPVPGPCELTLCMDHGQVTAICRVIKVGNFYDALQAADAPSPEGSDDENDFLRIELLLSHIRHRPGTRHRPRRRFRSAPPALVSL